MRLLNFYTPDGEVHLGVVQGDRVLDLTSIGGYRPEFGSLSAWLRAGKAARQVADELLGSGQTSRAEAVPLATLWHAPLVGRQARIFCVGLNYADHAAENNLPPPSSPITSQPILVRELSRWRRTAGTKRASSATSA